LSYFRRRPNANPAGFAGVIPSASDPGRLDRSAELHPLPSAVVVLRCRNRIAPAAQIRDTLKSKIHRVRKDRRTNETARGHRGRQGCLLGRVTFRPSLGVWIDQRLVDRDLIRALPDGAIEWQDLDGEAADLAREPVLAGAAKGLADWLLGDGPEPMRPALALALVGGKGLEAAQDLPAQGVAD
jgi:hypothetical protein